MIYQLDDGRIVGCGESEHGCSHSKSEVVRLANTRGKRGRGMSIYLGNLSVEQIEERTGITLTDEDREYLKKHRQEAVNDTPIADGAWHCFDIPFIIMTGNKATAEFYRDMLSTYDWSECKECLQIGWQRKGGDTEGAERSRKK